MTHVKVHPSVNAIIDRAFSDCTQLTSVTGGKGLKEIGYGAFGWCKLLHEILIPNTVKVIKYPTFYQCLWLMTVYG